jgi:hypothetical protein
MRKLLIEMLRYAAAIIADRENGCFLVVIATAGSPGIQAFKAMNKTLFNKLVQCPVDLQRRLEAMIAQSIQKRIGSQWLPGAGQRFKDKRLIPGKLRF